MTRSLRLWPLLAFLAAFSGALAADPAGPVEALALSPSTLESSLALQPSASWPKLVRTGDSRAPGDRSGKQPLPRARVRAGQQPTVVRTFFIPSRPTVPRSSEKLPYDATAPPRAA